MPQAPVAVVAVDKVSGAQVDLQTEDVVAVEEPLGILLGYTTDHGREQRDLAVTMRTPGADLDLVLGFLFAEGVIQSAADVISIRHCDAGLESGSAGNRVRVELSESVRVPPPVFRRQALQHSSCGICGKTAVEDLKVHCGLVPVSPGFQVAGEMLRSLPDAVRQRQPVFGATGGLHAVAWFDRTGVFVDLAEDVGRHNAMDKLVGRALASGRVPLSEAVLFFSGRASFEMMQKAARAGVPVVAAVGAPSSMAVACAEAFGITLVGFLRPDRFNLYAGAARIGECRTAFLPQARRPKRNL
jgi:FdhD protein